MQSIQTRGCSIASRERSPQRSGGARAGASYLECSRFNSTACFRRDLLREGLDEAVDDHLHCLVQGDTPGLKVLELFADDLASMLGLLIAQLTGE